MKVLVACEINGIVRDAFLTRGHDAWSCDIQHSEHARHITGDCLDAIERGWDLVIAHPPCTHIACSGAKHFAKKRADGRQQEAVSFFMSVVVMLGAYSKRWCIENPVCIMSTHWRKPDQIIQPWQFGDEAQKTTCLWLCNLSKLVPTKVVGRGEFITTPSGKRLPKWYSDNKSSAVRSKTFQGIADAMAEQWGVL